MTRILLVDDSLQWRLLVFSILKRTSLFQIVGEASDGLEGITKASALLPDVVLLDMAMPRLNGIEAAKTIRQVSPESKIIFLTQDGDSDVRTAALATGASGYILKSRVYDELRTAIQTATAAGANLAEGREYAH